jgi:hypothetical protein
MKKNIYKAKILFLSLWGGLLTGCVDMDYNPASSISENGFWRDEADAKTAVTGVYDSWKNVYGWIWLSDGWTDLANDNGIQAGTGYSPTFWNKSKRDVKMGTHGMGTFDDLWALNYQCINRANVAIANIAKLPIGTTANALLLKQYDGELRFLRAACYFNLLDMFGSVPYFERKLTNEEAITMSKMSRPDIKDKIISDMDSAVKYLPISYPASEHGHFTKGAAIAFRGKIKLFWASWQERDAKRAIGGDFPGDLADADKYYKDAAVDFAEAMKSTYKYGLFKNGAVGTFSEIFTLTNESCNEIMISIKYQGGAIGQGQNMSGHCLGTRSIGNSGTWFTPIPELWNVFQDKTTGDFATPVTYGNGTGANDIINNTAFANRDLRMGATVVLHGSSMFAIISGSGAVGTTPLVFNVRQQNNEAKGWLRSDTPNNLAFRKMVTQWPGQLTRSDDAYDIPLMRYADVMLMYAEAMNKAYGPSTEVYTQIDKLRTRGGLPALDKVKYASKEDVHKAIVQERKAELILESGCRYSDIRRWGLVEEIFGGNKGFVFKAFDNTDKTNIYARRFENATAREFQRYYIQNIPLAEIVRNPNLLPQNPEW